MEMLMFRALNVGHLGKVAESHSRTEKPSASSVPRPQGDTPLVSDLSPF